MKKFKIAALLLVSALVLAGCGKKETETEKPTEKVTEAETKEVIQPQETTGETEAGETLPEGKVRSYLTGKVVDEEIGAKRPFAVMLNNIINACPQAGISRADVVYEAPVEGAITRLMGIFEDYKGMEKIGSVRSCRDYYIDFALEFDAYYTHFGQAVYAFDLLNSGIVDNISGLGSQEKAGKINGYAGEDIFYRTSDRPSPHNVYTSEEQLLTAVERKEYSRDYSEDYNGHFVFAKDDETVEFSEKANVIRPGYLINKPWFEYDADNGVYKRFQYGDAHIDQNTGEQITFTNVIIQACPIVPYDDNGYLNIDTNAGGEAYYFTKGTYEKCTWKKDSEWGPARYYNADGEEITINQGKTWVCIVDANNTDDIVIE